MTFTDGNDPRIVLEQVQKWQKGNHKEGKEEGKEAEGRIKSGRDPYARQ